MQRTTDEVRTGDREGKDGEEARKKPCRK